jgi:hypothetical protein
MNSDYQIEEAEIFGRYIIGKPINQIAIERYVSGIHKLGYNSLDNISQLILKKPYLLPYLDAGFSLLDKKKLLQKKLLLMFAILETLPEYSQYFLAKPRNIFYLFTLFFVGIKAIFKTIIGVFLILIVVKKTI